MIRNSRFAPLVVVCALHWLLLAPLSAQENDADQARLVQTLMRRIEQLEKKVADLEQHTAAAVPAPAAAGQSAPASNAGVKAAPMEAMAHSHDTAPDLGTGQTFPFLKIAGFGDVNFSATTAPGAPSGFNEGQFVLHLTSALSSRVTYFGELSLTARSDAGKGTPPAAGFNAEVERSIIRLDVNDHLKLSFGRYHTPINYWNNTFHHGSWLQTTVSRPEMAQFGGSLIPIHFVGALVEGALPFAGLNLNYNAGIGNGRGAIISRGGDFGDINNSRAWLVNLFVKPDRLYALQVGGSVYRDHISPLTSPEVREWIESGHIVWKKENPEIVAEFANIRHIQIGQTNPSSSQAWYVQTAYRLPWFERAWKPYYRFEHIHIPRSDLTFRSVPRLTGSIIGLRFDISSFSAIKLEYRNQLRPDLPRIHSVFAQTSFTF